LKYADASSKLFGPNTQALEASAIGLARAAAMDTMGQVLSSNTTISKIKVRVVILKKFTRCLQVSDMRQYLVTLGSCPLTEAEYEEFTASVLSGVDPSTVGKVDGTSPAIVSGQQVFSGSTFCIFCFHRFRSLHL
jgi:hypothetical protein